MWKIQQSSCPKQKLHQLWIFPLLLSWFYRKHVISAQMWQNLHGLRTWLSQLLQSLSCLTRWVKYDYRVRLLAWEWSYRAGQHINSINKSRKASIFEWRHAELTKRARTDKIRFVYRTAAKSRVTLYYTEHGCALYANVQSNHLTTNDARCRV